MNSTRSYNFSIIFIASFVLLFNILGGTIAVLAQTGSMTASAIPSNSTPNIGDQITVTVNIDVSGVNSPNNKLGSFTGSLNWDSSIISYNSNSGIQAGFTGMINAASAGSGQIIFNGANPSGATGSINVLTITFDVIGTGSSALDLDFSAMSAAMTFANLLPICTVTDGTVTISLPQNTLTMAVSPSGSGITLPSVGDHDYDSGSVINITATPASGYQFVSWSGDVANSSSASTTVTVDDDKTVTANFERIQYTLTMAVTPSGGGTTSPSVGNHDYDSETVVNITAAPATGYQFVGWSGNVANSSSASTTVTMDDNQTVTAEFSQQQYTLNVNRVGNGSVSSSPNQSSYNYGDEVELTATADAGWTFAGWSGDLVSTSNPATITMNGNKSVTATFTQNEYELTVSVVGNGSIGKSPDQSKYHYGDDVELTATADAGWTFAGWSGDLNSTNNPATVTINGNKSVTATFTQNEYELTVNVVGNGSIDKSPDQSKYHYSDDVELTATADAGWTFGGWSGDLNSTDNPATITMNGNRTVTATFTQDEYELTVNVVGNGSIDKSPNQSKYHYGDDVELTSTAGAGWTFAGWSGDLVSTENPATITMNGNKSVTATFTENTYELTLNVVGNGSIERSPDQSEYNYGDDVELTATADAGWTFAGWLGDLVSTDNPVTITMDGNKTVTATFTQDEYELTVSVIGNGSVEMSPDQSEYNYGDDVELTPTADAGWTFAGWSGDLVSTDNPATITIDGNKTVTATFTQDEYELTVNVVGNGSVGKSPDQIKYNYGDEVELTATPDADWTFAGWSGNLVSAENPVTITMNGNKTITATFTQNGYALTVDVVGNGSVQKSPNLSEYNPGDEVELTAIAYEGWEFTGWTGALTSTENPVSITMDGHKAVIATFEQIHYTLTIGSDPSEAGMTTPVAGEHEYVFGSIVEISAEPATGYQFIGWTGDVADPESLSTTVTIDANKLVTANFSQITHILSIAIDPPEGGSSAPVEGEHTYPDGAVVEITAAPANGYRFVSWSDNVTDPDSLSTTIIIDDDRAVTAYFELIPQFMLTLVANPVAGGTIDPAAGDYSYPEGTVVTITALPASAYQFVTWTGSVADSEQITTTVMMDANKTVVANYESTLSDVAQQSAVPEEFAVRQNYPNPFNPTTNIDYQLPEAAHVNLAIYNLLGQKIRVLVDEHKAAGNYQAMWDGKDDFGEELTAGFYLYKFQAGPFTEIKKMLFLK